MTARLLVLACSQAKVAQSGAAAPAYVLYDGPAWRVYRRWFREHPVAAAKLPVLALSAEHGLIPATKAIATYDRKLDAARVEELASDDFDRELLRCYLVDEPDILLFGGPLYADLFTRLLPEDYLYRRAGDEGRGIGDQLAELKEWLEAVAAPAHAA